MNEQILINYTPTENGFTLSIAGDYRHFDYQDEQHQPEEKTLEINSLLQEIINKLK